MHSHINDMDHQISSFHGDVEAVGKRWRHTVIMAVAIIMMIVYDDCGGSCSGENDIDDDVVCLLLL